LEKGDPDGWAKPAKGRGAPQLSKISQQSFRFAALGIHVTLQIWIALQARMGNVLEQLKSEAPVSRDAAAQP